ncbi:DUF7619 domain-containing protein [Nonlabens ulvanivorans]|uniref:T9SS type A sorting domain-containing protein n=2 Tax=Nonlabens ulvanivorans TaxID=906888 RepID=UPI0032677903
MKTNYLFIAITFILCINASAQIINIPDNTLKNLLVNTNVTDTTGNGGADSDVDTNNDGEIQQSEANNVTTLYLGFNTGVQSLEGIQFFNNLEELRIRNSQVSNVPVFTMNSLKLIILDDNQVSNIDVSNLPNLEVLLLDDTLVSNIDVTQNPNLEQLSSANNNLSNIDVTQNPNLQQLILNNNSLSSINITQNPNLVALELNDNNLSTIDLSQNSLLSKIALNNNPISSLDVSSSPDINTFELDNTLITNLDLSNQLTIYYLTVVNTPLVSFTGLSNKLELDSLIIKNTSLTSLVINNNSSFVSGIEIENNSLLTSIQMNNNDGFFGNNIINNPNLLNLEANNNSTFGLYTDNNGLENIRIENGTQLDYIQFNNEANLQELSFLKTDTSTFGNNFIINNCIIDRLIIKNGISDVINFTGTNSINYICGDNDEILALSATLNNGGITNVNLNTYCTFTPGGDLHKITGDVRIDSDLNGCSVSDTRFTDFKFTVDNGTTSAIFFESPGYDYEIAVPQGNYTIRPEPVAPALYNPLNTFNANFSMGSPDVIQDICLVPNGSDIDLAIIIDEILPARPGFVSGYRLICSNLGTAASNGTVFLNYNNSLVQYQGSSESPASVNNGILSWNLNTLQPGQTHIITTDFRINSPMDIPAVNGGDVLVYFGDIAAPSGVADVNTSNNTFEFAQTIVNSYDPNDIACLEGAILDPANVGEDLHYKIRFENTGTASAINVVVKNTIDTSRLDITSFQPLTSSHPMRTRIIDGNVVEFIFENINLDFNDATNDGYLIYKIQSLPTLQLGDMISNQAEIYFDFNFPIITNDHMVTIDQTASLNDANSNSVSLFPNPSYGKVTINSSSYIQAIQIFDHLGRIVKSLSVKQENLEMNIDISELNTGLYFIKVKNESGEQSIKLIKE